MSVAKLVFVMKGEDLERQLAEAPDRGYVSHVLVEVDGDKDRLYPVFFYSIDRLAGELTIGCEQGEPFIAETGMIVLPKISVAAIEDAVQRLCEEGYFEYMHPLSPEQIASADPFRWPP